jgi:hypothetical protein
MMKDTGSSSLPSSKDEIMATCALHEKKKDRLGVREILAFYKYLTVTHHI